MQRSGFWTLLKNSLDIAIGVMNTFIHKYAGVHVCTAGIIHKAEKSRIFMHIETPSLGTIRETTGNRTLLTVLGMGSEQEPQNFFSILWLLTFHGHIHLWLFLLTLFLTPLYTNKSICPYSPEHVFSYLVLRTENTFFLALGSDCCCSSLWKCGLIRFVSQTQLLMYDPFPACFFF